MQCVYCLYATAVSRLRLRLGVQRHAADQTVVAAVGVDVECLPAREKRRGRGDRHRDELLFLGLEVKRPGDDLDRPAGRHGEVLPAVTLRVEVTQRLSLKWYAGLPVSGHVSTVANLVAVDGSEQGVTVGLQRHGLNAVALVDDGKLKDRRRVEGA